MQAIAASRTVVREGLHMPISCFRVLYLDMNAAENYRRNLVYWRNKRGHSLRDLAELAAPATAAGISNIENAKRVPGLDFADRLAKALQLELVDMLAPRRLSRKIDPLRKSKKTG